MKRIWRTITIFSIIASLTALSIGCADNINQGTDQGKKQELSTKQRRADQDRQQQLSTRQQQGTGRMGMLQTDHQKLGQGTQEGNRSNDQDQAIIRLTEKDGKLYVPVQELAGLLQFKSEWDSETSMFQIGDNDVAYEIKPNSTQARKEGETVTLSSPAIKLDGGAYIPFESLDALFGDAMDYHISGDELRLIPQQDDDLSDASGIPDFEDDPNDPFKGEDDGTTDQVSFSGDIPASAVALKNINMNNLIRTARKYIGVPYDFGAKPYAKSKKFDCSSYTQYVFAKHGVKLPRASRAQGKKGKSVSRKNLRKGDLMFFYLPGRYKSNKIVGHVGIYMGNGKMIHSSNAPKDGVQITSINKAFWKKTYLFSRRVAY